VALGWETRRVRTLLIVNPVGTRVRTGVRVEVATALAAGLELTVTETTHRGHATELAAGAAGAGFELVVVMGGDGTVNEVVNGLEAGGPVRLGLVGGGKTNVFARALGLPGAPVEAAAELLNLLAAGSTRTVSLGVASGRRFAFVAGLGVDGAIVREVERWRLAHKVHDDGVYFMAGLRTLATWDRSAPRLIVKPDGGRPLRGFFAVAGNGDPYTYVGTRPLRATPGARFEAGLDVLVAQTMSARQITRALAGMLALSPQPQPEPPGYPGLPVLVDQTSCLLEAEVPLPFQLDGEYLGDVDGVELRSLPGALTVVAPPEPGGDEPGGDGSAQDERRSGGHWNELRAGR
jgi:diacylglycerol kinase family enzyme